MHNQTAIEMKSDLNSRPLFEFSMTETAHTPFWVIRFQGREALSTLYTFTVTLACRDLHFAFETVLASPCRLRIYSTPEQYHDFHGLLSEVQLLSHDETYLYLQVTLKPTVWALTQGCNCKIFLNHSLPQIIQSILDDQQNNNIRIVYQLKLTSSYPVREFTCQYNESSWQFLSRLMEQAGIYYYFEQGSQEESLVITDHHTVHQEKSAVGPFYSPNSDIAHQQQQLQVLSRWIAIRRTAPRKVLLKGYNPERPMQPPISQTEIAMDGFGVLYYYGEPFSSCQEGDPLAQIYAQQLYQQTHLYEAESVSAAVQPGFLFTLQGHFLAQFNQTYLVMTLNHTGDQSGWVVPNCQTSTDPFYRNQFTALAAQHPYRPLKKTPTPYIKGVLTGTIDAIGNGEAAMLDQQGRYKVVFPFDLSEKQGGKASHWLRMAQPYGGHKGGMHFPLCKGTEVLITFIHGDPDRPIIQATLPNSDNPSVVNEENAMVNKICTPSGNVLTLEDTVGQQNITFSSKNNTITIGDIVIE